MFMNISASLSQIFITNAIPFRHDGYACKREKWTTLTDWFAEGMNCVPK
jgi:hypothetical protein